MSPSYGFINEINVDNTLEWQSKLYLTFDIDWAHDEVIYDTLQVLDEYGASATLFATHESKVLIEGCLNNPKYEIGIHPNFNLLLNNSIKNKSFDNICTELKDSFPFASSVRSHALCFGSLIQTSYEKLGITHDSSVMIPSLHNTHSIFPWKMWDNLIRVPYFFEDYVTAKTRDKTSIKTLISRPGLKVFDFHPIHVFLNTESLDRYEKTRKIHQDPKDLINYRYTGYGTRNRLIDLLKVLRTS